MIFLDKHRRARKNLSAYVDGELSTKDVTALESHLETCEACQLELHNLRATIGALRDLPEAEPRRSFALTPEMVEAPRPLPERAPTPALAHGMRLTAAGLAAALVLVFVIDVTDNGASDQDSTGGALFPMGPTAERNLSADDALADDIAIPGAAGGDAEATSVPLPTGDSGYQVAPTATVVPLNSENLDGGGDAGSASGGVGGTPDSDGGEDRGSGDTDPAEPVAEPPSVGEDDGEAATADDTDDGAEEPEKQITSNDLNGSNANDAGGAELSSSPSTEDGDGISTLLAIEIGLAVALATATAAAVGLTIAGHRRRLDL